MNTLRTLAGISALAAALGASAVQAGKLYKWTDEKGVVHYSETLPADAKDRSNTEIDKRGRELRKNDAALSPAQIKAIEDDKDRRKAEEKQLAEQKRRDNALLNTYTTEAEIDGARDRALAGATQSLQAIEARLKTTRGKIEGLRKQAADWKAKGKPVPEPLKEEIASAEREDTKIGADLKNKQAELENLRQKYEYDKNRFRELVAAQKK